MNHAFDYCKTPAKVTKRELINALHQCLMQLNAAEKENRGSHLDHEPAKLKAATALRKAGHLGFTP